MTRLIIYINLFLSLYGCGLTKKSINFDKIIFHTTRCYGACPAFHLQIDKDKSIKLYIEAEYKIDKKYYSVDSSKIGYFVGTIDTRLYNKLMKELQTININRLKFSGERCCDGSMITIIIYYDGKRKYLQSMFPPKKADKLISILYDVCMKSTLLPSEEKFEIGYEGK